MYKLFKIGALSIIIASLLVACGKNAQELSGKKIDQNSQLSASEDTGDSKIKEDNNPGPGEIGHIIKDDRGTAELIKVEEVNEAIELDPVIFTIETMEIFQLTELSEEYANQMSHFTDREIDPKEGFVFLQVTSNLENTKDQYVTFEGIDKIVTNKGQEIEGWHSDFIADASELKGDLMGKVNGPMYDGFILNQKDISTLNFFTSDVTEQNTYDLIAGGKEVTLMFDH